MSPSPRRGRTVVVMRKGTAIVGEDMHSFAEAERLDKVADIVIGPDGRHVVALVVDEGGFMSSSKVVPTEDVTSFGKDAVVVRSSQSIVSASEQTNLRALVERDE